MIGDMLEALRDEIRMPEGCEIKSASEPEPFMVVEKIDKMDLALGTKLNRRIAAKLHSRFYSLYIDKCTR